MHNHYSKEVASLLYVKLAACYFLSLLCTVQLLFHGMDLKYKHYLCITFKLLFLHSVQHAVKLNKHINFFSGTINESLSE